MPPPFTSRGRMTAQPSRPVQRYRPGKPIAEEASSSEEEEEEEEGEERAREEERQRQKQQQQQRKPAPPPPKATSFPTGAAQQITSGVKDVRLQEEDEDEEGFVTEEEEADEQNVQATIAARPPVETTTAQQQARPAPGEPEAESEESEEEEESSEEESSSEEEAPKKMLRPTFIKKGQRKDTPAAGANGHVTGDTGAEQENAEEQRKARTDEMIRDQLEKEAAARAARKKAWDDDEAEGVEESHIDDTDGLDPAAEYAAWKLRELKRVKRERETIEAAEKEREEVERRRNLSTEEREREDREFLEKQKEDQAGRGKAGYMQRYFHKGAFFQPEAEKHGLNKRDLMGSHYVDEVRNREAMPEYLQVRDMTKIGRKGRTKYRDLKTEDTGRWGVDNYYRKGATASSAARFGIKDERFLPDDRRDEEESTGRQRTGPNATAVKDRRERPRYRSRSRSRELPSRRSYSRSRSRSPPSRDRHRGDDRSRRKRSPSPYDDRDKRRRIDNAA